MLASCILAAAALAARVSAQQFTTTSTSTSSSPSPSSSGKVIEIAVGSKLHLFDPEQVTAEVGDIIRFNFYPGAHRVARGEYTQPCIPYEYTGSNLKGFYTGVFDPKTIQIPHPSYDVRVNNTDPIWFYCIAPGSCYEYGMVGVVNPGKNETVKDFKERAIAATYQLIPGEPFPSETVPGTPGPTKTATPSGAGSGGNSNGSGNTEAPKESSGGSGLGAGAIAGIAIGAAAVVIIGAALIYLCGRRGGFDKAYRKSVHPAGATDVIPPPMVDHKYGGIPKSPGQATMSTFAGHHDPYRVSAQSPHAQHFTGTPPPPLSPGFTNGYGTYNGTLPSQAHYPPMGDAQGQHAAYQQPLHSPPLQSPQFQAPVELPSAEHPAPTQSPPPQYLQGGNRDSWTTGQEANYQSTKPRA